MAVTLDLGPLLAVRKQLARAALASTIAIYVHGLIALVLLTELRLHPAGLLVLSPILVLLVVSVRQPAQRLVNGTLTRGYRNFFLLEALYAGAICLAAGPGSEGSLAGALTTAIAAAATARPIVSAQRLAKRVGPAIRGLEDPRVLHACLEKDVRGALHARARAFAGNRVRFAAPWLAAVAAGAAAAVASAAILSAFGLRENNGIPMAAGFAGAWAFFRATRHVKPRAALRRARDPRPPVLLLRQFDDDALSAGGRMLGVGPTFEHFLAGELERIGPTVSVGRPGERLQPLGAARDYLEGDWKQGVQTLIADAAVVVFLLGDSDSLLWECRATIAARGAACALVIVPPLSTEAEIARRWSRFVEAMEDLVPDPPPRALPGAPAVAVFFAGGQAVVMTAETRTKVRSLVSQALPEFRVALRLFEQIRTARLDSPAALGAFLESQVPLVRVTGVLAASGSRPR